MELINFVYAFWVENCRPPNYLAIQQSLQLPPRRTRRLFRELEEGFALTSEDHLIGFSIDKAPPFSATPTTIAAFVEGRFLSYVGCPMEGFTVGGLPPLQDRVLTLRSFCACCFEEIELEMRGHELLSSSPAEPLISVIRPPYAWEGGVSCTVVCDSFHYVLDGAHAERFERRTAHRGITLTMEQASRMTAEVAARRMRDPSFPQIRLEAEPMLAVLEEIGVDVSVWRV
jgi:Alkylmercury lyase